MKAWGTSFELYEGFLCSFCILEKFNTDFGGLRRTFRDNSLKYGTHRSHSIVQCRCEIGDRREAKAACEAAQWVRLVRNSVSLLFGFDLQAVVATVANNIVNSLIGYAILLLGIPACRFWQRQNRSA